MKCNHCGSTVPSVSVVCPFCKEVIDPNAKPVTDFGNISDTDYDKKSTLVAYIKEPKNKKVVILGISVIVVVIIIFGALILSLFSGSNRPDYMVFTDVVTYVSEYLNDNYFDDAATYSGEYELDLNINGEATEYRGEYALDIASKVARLTGIMRDPQESTGGIILESKDFSFTSYLENNELFFSSPQALGSTYILFPLDDPYGLLSTRNYNLTTLVSSIASACNAALEQMNYETTLEEIEHRGETLQATKLNLVLDNAQKRVFLTTFYATLIEDSNFLNELSRLRDQTTDEIITILKNYSTTAEYAYSGSSDYRSEIAIYYNANNIYRIEVIFDEEDIADTIWRVEIGDNRLYLYYIVEDDTVFEMELTYTERDYQDHILKTYDVVYSSESLNFEATLEAEDQKQVVISREDITDYKNIRDFSVEDYNTVRTNLSPLLEDVSWLEEFGALFNDRCRTAYNCVCNDGEDTCTCRVDNDGTSEIITCPKEDVSSVTTTDNVS